MAVVRFVASEQLVEEVIGTVEPRVVMVELDAHRGGLLPKGEVHKVGAVLVLRSWSHLLLQR